MSSGSLSNLQAKRELKEPIGIDVANIFRWATRNRAGPTREICG